MISAVPYLPEIKSSLNVHHFTSFIDEMDRKRIRKYSNCDELKEISPT